jgi:TolB-like protein/tetratricopeptide (TPR) repeat protein/DNA-binding winged helix-turn-helix (wHTH) protein
MDAAELQRGFYVGDWLVEPQASRASCGATARDLTADELHLLVALAERHGEAVGRRELRHRLWPNQPGAEERLRATVASLRQLFGDTPRQRRHIASVGQDALALVARFRLADARAAPVAGAAAVAPGAADDGGANVGSRLHWLLGELRRRNVLKVLASYLVVTWIVLQVAQVTFAPLRFPDWWMTALTIVAILGLPIVGAMAWAYEITPQGVVADSGVVGPGAVRLPRPRQSLAPVLVAGVALMAGVTGFAWWRSLASATDPLDAALLEPEAGVKSIAVLPLVDMSPGGGNGWLGDGLSEELSTRLAQVPGLRVAARTSAFEFRGRNLDVRRIGQSLGVRHVLEGSVRRDGDDVRVTVQLIDSGTGYHLWAGNFDRPWSDVLDLQDEVARSVADALQVVLAQRPDPGASGGTAQLDVRAIDWYIEGLALLRQPADTSVLRRAEDSFRKVIAAAPGYAGAHSGLCRTLVRRFEHTREREVLLEAEQACRRGLALDPTLLDTERGLAALYLSDGKPEQAVAAYRKALERNPRDVDALIRLGEALDTIGQDVQAEAAFRQAVAVEPSFWGAHSGLGSFLFRRGRTEEAIASFRRSAELVPTSAFAWNNLGGALHLSGDFAEAERAYQRSLEIEPSKAAYSNVATIQFGAGNFKAAVQNYQKAVELGEHDHTVHGNLGDALWQLPERRAEAVAAYRAAIARASAELVSTPDDPMLQAQLGYYYGRTGDAARAAEHLGEAVRHGSGLVYVQYYLGVAAADRGDRAAALTAVRQLVALGYPAGLLRSAPEFRSLLQDPEYKKIVGEDPVTSR